VKNESERKRVYRPKKFVLLDKRTSFDSAMGTGVNRAYGRWQIIQQQNSVLPANGR
jgi:hypothetical protein